MRKLTIFPVDNGFICDYEDSEDPGGRIIEVVEEDEADRGGVDAEVALLNEVIDLLGFQRSKWQRRAVALVEEPSE
jgi:hypothetical protein